VHIVGIRERYLVVPGSLKQLTRSGQRVPLSMIFTVTDYNSEFQELFTFAPSYVQD
jgi:hypothetical protein